MQKPKGTRDIYGYNQELKSYIKNILFEISSLFNFKEIETPIFERKEVFFRAVGETSDIVSKEMYEFIDKGGRDMVLRPEGTAGVIRAIVENKLYANRMPLKYCYFGPMFRYENPQKGRQRQFTQFGIETLGEKSPLLDAEIILMASTILDAFNLSYELKINSLGTKETREKWSQELKKYFEKYKDQLTEDSLKRLSTNPMRILDDKIEQQKDFVKKAPKISEFYSEEVKNYFGQLIGFLASMGIKYTVDQNLVRGLDYYTDTCFEFVSTSSSSGSQSTLIGGGRYENLVSQFEGPDLPGIGFGLGVERIMNDLEEKISSEQLENNPLVYVLNIDENTSNAALGIVYMLRKAGIATEWNYIATKLQKAFKKADDEKAQILIIVGPRDLEREEVVVKIGEKQEVVKLDKLLEYVDKKAGEIYEKN